MDLQRIFGRLEIGLKTNLELGVVAEGRTPERPETERSSVQSLFVNNRAPDRWVTERPNAQTIFTVC